MPRTVTTHHSVVNDDGVIVRANHCVVNGDRCVVTGDHCVINGDRCIVRGRHNVINGDRCEVHGDHAIINGDNCTGPAVSSARSRRGGQSVTVGSGVGVIQAPDVTFSGGGMRISTGGTIMNFSGSHGLGNTVRLVKPDGVYEYTGGGGANVRDGRIYLDGADITEACKVSSFPSSSSSSSASSSSAKRKKDHDKKSRKKKKDEPFPADQKASKAEGEEKSCCVCMDNKIDTRLDPCGHIILCIDCAKEIYEAKRKCPTCNAKFEKIQTAFL